MSVKRVSQINFDHGVLLLLLLLHGVLLLPVATENRMRNDIVGFFPTGLSTTEWYSSWVRSVIQIVLNNNNNTSHDRNTCGAIYYCTRGRRTHDVIIIYCTVVRARLSIYSHKNPLIQNSRRPCKPIPFIQADLRTAIHGVTSPGPLAWTIRALPG